MSSDWGIVFVFLMLSDVLFMFLPFVFSLVAVSHGGLLFGGSFGFEDWR